MYNYIKGVVKDIDPKFIVLENNGIGYEIVTPNPYIYNIDDNIIVYIYEYIKEDSHVLYGFSSKDAKSLFLKLLSVNGIGPKSALSILASGNIKEVIEEIENGNSDFLRKFTGIGPKASMQIVLDLKGKLDSKENILTNPKLDIIIEALLSLGYSKTESKKIISKLDLKKSEGDLIKDSLKLLNS